MNIVYYKINEKNLVGENDKKYISYGVDCFESENGFESLITQIIDISTDFSTVQKFVSLINEMKLSDVQLRDAVEDFICSEY